MSEAAEMTGVTIFGEKVDVHSEVDALYCQLINILHADERFEAALTKGALTDEAKESIADAFAEVFERNRRLANIFLSDRNAQREFTGFWFARAYAEVQANKAFNDAFRRVSALAKAGAQS